MGLCVFSSAASFGQVLDKQQLLDQQAENIKCLMLKEKFELEKTGMSHVQCSDIIGDNIDISRNPSQMSKDRRRKSWHWFLLVGLNKRVLNPELDDSQPIAEINSVENSTFVPNFNDCNTLDRNFIFHIMHVLVNYIGCLKKYKKCLPNFISHLHLEELSRKSDFAILVLTNERAYSAKLAMLNGQTDFERLAGVVHRPEGLHRMMNLLLVFH